MKNEIAALLRSAAGESMILQGVQAVGRLSGMLFELSVTQRYKNPSEKNLEVVYTFPLAWGTVLLELEVIIGGKTLTGVVVEKKAAERDYEKALAEGDSPIMVERAADGLYTLNLGNLMGGEEASIRYRYAQAIRAEQGRLRLTVPTTIAPRYGDPRESGMQSHQVPGQSMLVEYPFAIEIDIDAPLSAATVASPTHQVATARTDAGVRVSLAKEAYLDRDFVLTLDGLPSLSVSCVAADADAYVAMASFCPAVEQAQVVPRSLKIVIDCSGSMAGDSIGVAKRAVLEILSRLRGEDCFNITRFGSHHEHLFKEMQPAQGQYLAQAKEHVASMQADLGGTEMANALRAAYRLKGPWETADILMITDGEIKAVEPLVREAKAQGQRVFAVGVGSAPAESLLRKLAEATGGACELVVPGDRIEAAAVRLVTRMQAPQSDQVSVDWPSEPIWTASIPRALYAGDTVHVFAGFAARPEGETVLRYSVKDGTGERRMAVKFPAKLTGGDTLARLAAAERLKDGLPEPQELELALRHQLVTARTNLLVIHQRPGNEKAKDLPALATQAQMLAAGWGAVGSVAGAGVDFAMLSVGSLSQERRVPGRSSAFDGASYDPTDMPSFLRRDIEAPELPEALRKRESGYSLTPKEFAEALSWDFSRGEATLPKKIGDLRRLGVPSEICEALARLKEWGIPERVAVAAFMAALLDARPVAEEFGRHFRRQLAEFEDQARSAPELIRRMAHLLSQCGPHHWPDDRAWHEAFGW